MIRKFEKQVWALLLLVTVLFATGCDCAGRVFGPGMRRGMMTPDPLPVEPPSVVAPGETFAVAAAGDIAGRWNRHELTAELLMHRLKAGRRGGGTPPRLAAILALGDIEYPNGAYSDFLAYYAPTWGVAALKELTRPVPGNHDYEGSDTAPGYFDYFNGRDAYHGVAGERSRGYYSFDLGDWHFIGLNSSNGCRAIDCRAGSPMHHWLVKDLRTTTKKCVLAYVHTPRFQQGDFHGDTEAMAPLWDALYDAGADILLAGHEHNFQQLAPLDKRGQIDRERGIRSFVVGTGGAVAYQHFEENERAGVLEAKVAGRFGILELTLSPGAYRWRFVAVNETREGEALVEGKDVCH